MNMLIYKVTAVVEKKTKHGDIVYNIQLNNSLWVNYIYPDEIWQSSGRHNISVHYELNHFWKNNNFSLKNLVGNLIAATLYTSDFGTQFGYVSSIDLIHDFKTLLDQNFGKAFSTELPIYTFLESHNYQKNIDNSITLKKPYDFYNVIQKDDYTVCYPKKIEKNTLSLDNIESIFMEFYADQQIETSNDDLNCKYQITYTSIIKYCEKSHKYKSKIIGKFSETILKLGDKLSQEQIDFLSRIPN